MEYCKCIAKNDQGIENILILVNKIKKHNISYFEGTMRYFIREHPPYKDSFIYYDHDNNDFKFISASKAYILKYKRWADYEQNDVVWIRENTFCFLCVEPFSVIVSNATFLEKENDIRSLAVKFYEYITKTCEKEDMIWKSIINKSNNTDKIIKLF